MKSDLIVFVREDEQDQPSARVIDFTARRMGQVRRALSHDVIHADDDYDDGFDFMLLAASGRRVR